MVTELCASSRCQFSDSQTTVLYSTFYDHLVNAKMEVKDFKGSLLSSPTLMVLSVISRAAAETAELLEICWKWKCPGLLYHKFWG